LQEIALASDRLVDALADEPTRRPESYSGQAPSFNSLLQGLERGVKARAGRSFQGPRTDN